MHAATWLNEEELDDVQIAFAREWDLLAARVRRIAARLAISPRVPALLWDLKVRGQCLSPIQELHHHLCGSNLIHPTCHPRVGPTLIFPQFALIIPFYRPSWGGTNVNYSICPVCPLLVGCFWAALRVARTRKTEPHHRARYPRSRTSAVCSRAGRALDGRNRAAHSVRACSEAVRGSCQ